MKKLLICFFLLTLLVVTSCSKGTSSSTSSTTSIPIDQQEMEKKYEGILKDKKIYIASIGLGIGLGTYEQLLNLGVPKENMVSHDLSSERKEDLLRASEVEPGAIVILVVDFSLRYTSECGTTVEEEIERGKEFKALQGRNRILNFVKHTSYLFDNNKYEIENKDIFRSFEVIDGSELYVFVNEKYRGGFDSNIEGDTPALGNYVQHMVKAYNPNLDYLQYDGTKHLEEVFLPLLVKGIGE